MTWPRTDTAYDRERRELYTRIEVLEAQRAVLVEYVQKHEDRLTKLEAWTRPPDKLCMKCGTAYVNAEHEANHTCDER